MPYSGWPLGRPSKASEDCRLPVNKVTAEDKPRCVTGKPRSDRPPIPALMPGTTFPRDLLRSQKPNILTTTAKDARVATFEPHDRAILLHRFRQQTVDVVLPTRRGKPIARAHRHQRALKGTVR